MRQLSSTLLAVQKSASRVPYLKLEATNKIGGLVRYDWQRLYTGSEPDQPHAVSIPGDGSLIRVRITPPADSRKLYRQRVATPSPQSDFSQWAYTGEYNALVVACVSLGAEVSIFWINSNRQVQRLKSTDYGASWGSPELVDYAPTTAVYGIAVAYKSNGDLALFFADQSTLYVKKCVNGNWQNKAAWDKTTGDLSGIACVYASDWDLLVSGKDASGNFKLWGLIYGDGGEVSANTWSALKELAAAPSDGDFEYKACFLDKPDAFRCFYVEKFSGSQTSSRPFWSYSVGDGFLGNLWHEPVPFDLSSEHGLAIAHHGDYCWLSSPNSVWQAPLSTQSLDLTVDILSVKQETTRESGKLTVELRNDTGQYATPGQGSLSVLDIGCQLELSPGYVTTAGNEISAGQTFILEAYEHTSAGGKASLILHAADGWAPLEIWKARHQFRWNKSNNEMSVKDILAFVLARVGLELLVKSQSSTITSFYPDFTIHQNDSGQTIIRKLLSFVPDVLFIEGNKAYLINPQPSDSSVYSYGSDHSILEGKYLKGAWALNRVKVDGYDPVGGTAIMVDSFAWAEISKQYDRIMQLSDRNLDSAAKAQARGEAYLRQAEIESASGFIRVPVNCGQQLYDVIDVTDARAGLDAEKKRVIGLSLVCSPRRAEYEQRLLLGAV